MRRLAPLQYATILRQAQSESTISGGALVDNFMTMLRRHRALKLLPGILNHLRLIENEAAGRTSVEVWSAVPAAELPIATLVKSHYPSLSLIVHHDPALMGGLKILIGDELIDGSIAGRLNQLRTHLLR